MPHHSSSAQQPVPWCEAHEYWCAACGGSWIFTFLVWRTLLAAAALTTGIIIWLVCGCTKNDIFFLNDTKQPRLKHEDFEKWQLNYNRDVFCLIFHILFWLRKCKKSSKVIKNWELRSNIDFHVFSSPHCMQYITTWMLFHRPGHISLVAEHLDWSVTVAAVQSSLCRHHRCRCRCHHSELRWVVPVGQCSEGTAGTVGHDTTDPVPHHLAVNNTGSLSATYHCHHHHHHITHISSHICDCRQRQVCGN